MNLRKRNATSTDSAPEVKRKHVPSSNEVRRSERNRSKPDEIIITKEDSKNDNRNARNKPRYSSKSRKKKSDEEDDLGLGAPLFPAVCETGVKDLMSLEKLNTNDYSLLVEATPLFECRVCDAFFRELSDFIKHKQAFCTDRAENIAARYSTDMWNPFLNKELFDLFPDLGQDDSESDDSSDKASGIEHSYSQLDSSRTDHVEKLLNNIKKPQQ